MSSGLLLSENVENALGTHVGITTAFQNTAESMLKGHVDTREGPPQSCLDHYSEISIGTPTTPWTWGSTC